MTKEERRKELVRRAMARAEMGRGGEATRKRLGQGPEPRRPERRVSIDPNAPRGKTIDPNAATPADPAVPGQSQLQAFTPQGGLQPRLSDEDVAIRREGNFVRALIRARSGQGEVGDRTRQRLERGAAAGGYDESGEFSPQGFTVDAARGLSDEQFNALLNRFRQRRGNLGTKVKQYNV